MVHRVSSSLLGPVVPSFRALSGRLKFTVRRHKFNKDSPFFLSLGEAYDAEADAEAKAEGREAVPDEAGDGGFL